MININQFINEKLRLTNIRYTSCPKNKEELRKILEERLEKDKDADLNDIDVSNITNMGSENTKHGLFNGLDPRDIKIDRWNVSNVKDMSYMFYDCQNFTGETVETWDTSNVENMAGMFQKCAKLDCDLNDWDVSRVTDMGGMFYECRKFNSNLSNWDVSEVKNMRYMFGYCYKFTGEGLEQWEPNNLEDKENTFICAFSACVPSWGS